ncbi:iron-dicitrate transporter ATP-binding subunit [Streptomyces sp. JS01]|nr:iron-dicitrate transporter ATP-binding subunit [Streptomyces sp. JS01]MBK3533174.1 ABC transporter ATP-binding protein [Streptomyces sp. MBT72]MBK3539289.1 ABC transporter ATP-binding protein [Streptomyces sp. MBT67]MBK3551236.1 ABC transporter ATP-binding protein [Streptomyces sp. MBT61]MBK6031026.1 ABC transporter ATP-binding protein [Streptomyces sp. MBT59]
MIAPALDREDPPPRPSAPAAGATALPADDAGLDARDMTIAYDRTDVVHGADLRLPRGRVTALIGPNGSGKSTLLRAVARLHKARTGSVTVAAGAEDGAPVDALALSRSDFARRVTLLAQSRNAPAGLSVRDVVGFGRHPYRGRIRGADPDGARMVEHALTVTNLTEFADRGVESLSGGQLQRVWFACCLAQDTDVLLLDEPTTFLDLRYQVEILDLVRDLADTHGVTVGVVLHDLDQAAAVADQVVLLSSGRIVAAGTPAEVYAPERLTDAYGIRIDVELDSPTGIPRTRAVGRHHLRTERP